MGQFSTGERRGLIALLLILALVVAIMAINRGASGRVDAISEQQRVESEKPSIEEAAAPLSASDSIYSPKNRHGDSRGDASHKGAHRSGSGSKASSAHSAPARSPLDELNN